MSSSSETDSESGFSGEIGAVNLVQDRYLASAAQLTANSFPPDTSVCTKHPSCNLGRNGLRASLYLGSKYPHRAD